MKRLLNIIKSEHMVLQEFSSHVQAKFKYGNADAICYQTLKVWQNLKNLVGSIMVADRSLVYKAVRNNASSVVQSI